MSKDYLIKLCIVITWIVFYYVNWITYSRFIFFLIVIFIIMVYKWLIIYCERKALLEGIHPKRLNLLIYFNKLRNPILLSTINIDVFMYDIIILYNNKVINYIIYIFYVFLLNPIKIFYFKFYLILRIWKNNTILNILFSRMFGLILSVLIFSNIIAYMKTEFNLNIWMILYIYLLIISLSSETIVTRQNKWLKIFLVNHINTYSLLLNRVNINLISVSLNKIGIDEITFYIDGNIKNKINKIQIGYTFYLINNLKNFDNTPNYNFYIDLRSLLNTYLLTRIDSYIWFKYHGWKIPHLNFIRLDAIKNEKELQHLQKLFEYDYQVFKIILFLYWDLEYYLEDSDYVKRSLTLDYDDPVFLNIKFNEYSKSDIEFLEKSKYKIVNEFLLNPHIFNLIEKYDLYTKMYYFIVGEKYLDDEVVKQYTKINDIIIHTDICTLKEIEAVENPDVKFKIQFFESFIINWYEEWYSEINLDLTTKYLIKINNLEVEYQSLLKSLD